MPASEKGLEFYRKFVANVRICRTLPEVYFGLGTLHAVGIGIAPYLNGTGTNMKLLQLVNPREIRRRLGLNQEEFWTRIGVTQSGGSRYESGRTMPKPVRQLLRLVHVERVDLSRVKKEDFEIIDHLKSNHPDLYQSLRKAARSKRRKVEESKH